MSTTTCHLSSLEICEGDNVVLIPIKYQNLTETCQLVYGTNLSCTIAGLPIFGKYTEFKLIDIDPESEENFDIFRNKINKSLMNNPKTKETKANSKFYLGNSFYLFKRKEYNEVDRTEWYSDKEIIALTNKPERFYQTEKIESNNELLNYLSIGGLIETGGGAVNRFGYILIRLDIFEQITNSELYIERKSHISRELEELSNRKISNIDELFCDITESFLASKILTLFNFDGYLVYDMLLIIRNKMNPNKSSEFSPNFLKGLQYWGLVCAVYADLGKSFYPNVRRHGTMQHLQVFNNIVNSHIDNRVALNKENWLSDNDSEDPIPDNKLWNDWSRLY